MRWFADSPSVTNAAYCEGCKAERDEPWLCEECPAQEWLAILPENADAARVFYRGWRQWHIGTYVTGQGKDAVRCQIPIAPRLEGLESIARAMDVEWNADLLDKLQVMEAERIKVERERRDAGNP
ncbi:hypothetical protein [Natronospira bacteriovora]|uniref:Uncharacterized protein n=1 Tax=Natronospira bacteriovora TaxID=3069753 RepID=A0ABU0W8J1_9GAMM|nr:hypothetical protein [Natronospira sp. AB-CW4]MDQ2069315.1 hypothetical protein [Natronospira sp. AB-CW4]